jgi:hypothetical protein
MNQRIVTGAGVGVTEQGFISKVYLWMAAGLAVSGLGSFWLLSQPELLRVVFSNPWIFYGLVIAELVLVIWLSAAAMRLSGGVATLLFLGYSFLNGLTLTSVFLIYTGSSVMTTFAVTAGTFLFFAVYGATTKRDLTGVGSLAMMGLIGVILASLVSLFLKSSAVLWITTYVGIAVFMGLIAYDTQKLKAIYANAVTDAESARKAAIIGALALYLDFINLFIMLLRIFGRRRD